MGVLIRPGVVAVHWRFGFLLRREDQMMLKVEDAVWLFEKIEELAKINGLQVLGGIEPPSEKDYY